MHYEDVLPIDRDELRRALKSNSEGRAAKAVIAVALHDPDWKWAEKQCLNALKDPRSDVRAAGVTGLGHIARIHGRITASVIIPKLEALKADKSLGGVAEDAIEDILFFAKSANDDVPQ